MQKIKCQNTQKSKLTKFGLRLNFENYNSSFALQAESNKSKEEKENTRFKHQSDLFVRERAGPAGPAGLGLSLSK